MMNEAQAIPQMTTNELFKLILSSRSEQHDEKRKRKGETEYKNMWKRNIDLIKVALLFDRTRRAWCKCRGNSVMPTPSTTIITAHHQTLMTDN